VSILKLEGISHNYGQKQVMQDLSCQVAEGEKIVLLGANGSGKSTLLKILNALVFADQGRFLYDGLEITRKSLRARSTRRRFRQEVVLLFQNPDAMLFNPTVFDEVAFGLRQLGATDVEAQVHHWAEVFQITQHLSRPPFNLSSGEKQKVCLAALMAMGPRVLLLDEPTSALDPRSTGWLIDFLRGLDQTVLISTHNLSLAEELGQRALLLGEDHRLIYDGPIKPLLDDQPRLQEANLVHIHSHHHEGVKHRHYHTHDWD